VTPTREQVYDAIAGACDPDNGDTIEGLLGDRGVTWATYAVLDLLADAELDAEGELREQLTARYEAHRAADIAGFERAQDESQAEIVRLLERLAEAPLCTCTCRCGVQRDEHEHLESVTESRLTLYCSGFELNEEDGAPGCPVHPAEAPQPKVLWRGRTLQATHRNMTNTGDVPIEGYSVLTARFNVPHQTAVVVVEDTAPPVTEDPA